MNWKNATLTALTALAVLTAASDSRAGGNLITNGDFSNYTTGPEGPGSIGSNVLNYNYTRLTDWSDPQAYTIAALYDHTTLSSWWSDGSGRHYLPAAAAVNKPAGNYLLMDADRAAGYAYKLSQTISGLTAGQQYTISFWTSSLYANFGASTTHSEMQVQLGNSAWQTTPSVSVSPSNTWSGWVQNTMTFTADSNSDNLTFWANGGPNGYPPIIVMADLEMTAMVPEPTSIILATLGTLGVVGVGLRRRVMAERA